MRVLLDTNIIIHRETDKVVNVGIGKLFNWLDKFNYRKSIHPLTIKEVERHKNPDVVHTMSVKLENYYQLKTEAPLSDIIRKIINEFDKTENDRNDSRLLNELVNNRVDIFITEDKKIHKKAQSIGREIADRVFTIERFLEKMNSENPDLVDYKVLSVKKEYFGNLNLKDPFFDSFRNDYIGFDKWFNSKSDDIAYICYENDQVMAFLFLKLEGYEEDYRNITPSFSPKKRLKIGTFKVILNGYKLGERFLKIIFDNALSQNVDEIYVTIFEKTQEQARLIELLREWGFTNWGEKTTASGQEHVLVRNFERISNSSNPKYSFPYISRNSNSYLVPIYADYHTNLLPDSILNNESKYEFVENEPHRNAISKVYISRSITRDMKPGDTIIFYRTGERQPKRFTSVVTTFGIIESVITGISSEDEFIKLCRRRSVFSDEELKEHWNFNKKYRPFIVNFLYAYSFPKRATANDLIDGGVMRDIESAPRGFELITKKQFEFIIKITNTNESIIID